MHSMPSLGVCWRHIDSMMRVQVWDEHVYVFFLFFCWYYRLLFFVFLVFLLLFLVFRFSFFHKHIPFLIHLSFFLSFFLSFCYWFLFLSFCVLIYRFFLSFFLSFVIILCFSFFCNHISFSSFFCKYYRTANFQKKQNQAPSQK